MQRTIDIYQYTGFVHSRFSWVFIAGVHRWGIWKIYVPGFGTKYIDFGGSEDSGDYSAYPETYPDGIPSATVTFRVYRDETGKIMRSTLQVVAHSSAGTYREDMLGGEIPTVGYAQGQEYDALSDRCDLGNDAELSFLRTETETVTRLPLIINGTDFSEAAQRLGYSIEYEDRVGTSPTMMLNGDLYPDIIDRRAVIKWPLNMLWRDELANLHKALSNSNPYVPAYVPVTYFDAWRGWEQRRYFLGSIGPQVPGINNARGLAFQSGTVLTLRER